MYIETVPNRNSKPTILLRESRREGKRTIKRTIANLTALPPAQIEAIRQILKNKQLAPVDEIFVINASYSHGHILAVLTAMKKLGFSRLISSRPSKERDLVLAMVVSRILKPFSKLATTRWFNDTTLSMELPAVKEATENDLYNAMDWLVARQNIIEQKLAKRHLEKEGLVLYDLSSSYVEGDCCELAEYGYSRDKKRGKKQISYGLLTNKIGCPVAIETFPGNTKDNATVPQQIHKIKNGFKINQLVLVGDRGMITQKLIDYFKDTRDINWITALKNRQIQVLFENEAIKKGWFADKHLLEITYQSENNIVLLSSQPSDHLIQSAIGTTIFIYNSGNIWKYLITFSDKDVRPIKRKLALKDQEKICELLKVKELKNLEGCQFTDEDKGKILRNIACFRKHTNQNYSGERLIVCYNEQLAAKRRHDREELILRTEQELNNIKSKIEKGIISSEKELGICVGKNINKFKVSKLFDIEIEKDSLVFQLNKFALKREQETDGIYVIRTDLPKEQITGTEVVLRYKDLTKVEQAFRSLKTSSLKIRPIYHYVDNRVKAHIFLCMLAYYVEWHIRQVWRSLLFSDEEITLKQNRDPVTPSKPSGSAKQKAKSKRLTNGSVVHDFHSLLQHLGTIVRNQCCYKKARAGNCFTMDTTPNNKQAEALRLLENINVPSSV